MLTCNAIPGALQVCLAHGLRLVARVAVGAAREGAQVQLDARPRRLLSEAPPTPRQPAAPAVDDDDDALFVFAVADDLSRTLHPHLHPMYTAALSPSRHLNAHRSPVGRRATPTPTRAPALARPPGCGARARKPRSVWTCAPVLRPHNHVLRFLCCVVVL